MHQPLPAGRKVAIVSNGGGPGILAADACVAAGLEVPELSAGLQSVLRSVTPHGAGVRNPVDLVASADAANYAGALSALLDSGEVDSLVVLYVSPLVSRPQDIERAVIETAAHDGAIPTIACFLGDGVQRGPLRADGATRAIPTVTFPESAAGAIEHAVRLAEWRQRAIGSVPELEHVDRDAARTLVEGRLAAQPDGEWVDLLDAAELLAAYGIPVVATRRAATATQAASAADALGYPVVLKAGAPDLVHKTDVGGVRLGLRDRDAVLEAFDAMRAVLGDRMGGALVQPMAEPGVELIVGVTHDPMFGPLVLLGMGGVTAELVRDTTLRLVPLTDVDAHEMVRGLRSSPLLFGYRGAAPVDVGALEDVLLRVGRLVDDVPEVAELDCNPLVVSPTGVLALDVKVRLAPVDRPEGFAPEE